MFHFTEAQFTHVDAIFQLMGGTPLEPAILDGLASALSVTAARRLATWPRADVELLHFVVSKLGPGRCWTENTLSREQASHLLSCFERELWTSVALAPQAAPSDAESTCIALVFGPDRMTLGPTDWKTQDAWKARFKGALKVLRDQEWCREEKWNIRCVAALHYAETALDHFLAQGADSPGDHESGPVWLASLDLGIPRDCRVVLGDWLSAALAAGTSCPPLPDGVAAQPTRVPRNRIGDVLSGFGRP